MRTTQHSAPRLAVGLYPVSTAEQDQSGLGLEAQQASVRAFVAAQPDRITRRAQALSQLLEDGTAIRAADMPGADELMLRI
jgi:hypothetical protein